MKSLQSGNFQYYGEILKQITPWMFRLDHHNYAICLLAHLTQIIDLKEIKLSLFEKFSDEKFIVSKPNRNFSKTTLDRNQEQ